MKILLYKVLHKSGFVYIINCIKLVSWRRNQRRVLKGLKKKRKIKVLFIVVFESVWKYEQLYQRFELNDKYDPLLIIAPYNRKGISDAKLKDEVKDLSFKFKQKGYRVEYSFNLETKEWVKVNELIKPDLVFFTVPYNYTLEQFRIESFRNSLCFYTPYAFVVIDRIELHYKSLFYKYLCRYFVETEYHKNYASQFNIRTNIVVSGYPGLESFKAQVQVDVWKLNENSGVKKIIWAPHHTIPGDGAGLDYSSFMEYYNFMFYLLEYFSGRIQIAFKPHPLLREKLYKHSDWGFDRTEKYYEQWREHPYGQLDVGEYSNLFKTSDALIHDCASFLAEYLATGKPSAFLLRNLNSRPSFNSVGDILFDVHYKCASQEEIFSFINSVVLERNDEYHEKRMNVVEKLLIPKKNTPSEYIFEHLQNFLESGK